MSKGRAALLQNDKSKDNITSNYRPITCLLIIWKLLSGVVADQIYRNLHKQKLLPEELERCSKRSRGANDLLYIDKAVIREVKSRKKNVAMECRDYKKTYDMVLHL